MTVLVVCTVILAVSCISGLVKGFTGKASGILALVLSFILVQALLPTVTVYLREQTPVYGLREMCGYRRSGRAEEYLRGTLFIGRRRLYRYASGRKWKRLFRRFFFRRLSFCCSSGTDRRG